MTTRHLALVPDLAMALSIDDLPAEVRDAAVSHAAWYAARNAEDGKPRKAPKWTRDGAILSVRQTFLALGLAAGVQRGTDDREALLARCEQQRKRVAELQVAADAGVALARAQAEFTEAQIALVTNSEHAEAPTDAIPRQRGVSA